MDAGIDWPQRSVIYQQGLGVRHHVCALIVAWKGSQSHVLALRADVRVFLPRVIPVSR